MRRRFQRSNTRFSKDGRSAFVVLQIERRQYEFARAWAAFHAPADPEGTAEDHLEGRLYTDLMEEMDKAGWHPPPEIEALFPTPEESNEPPETGDDYIPF